MMNKYLLFLVVLCLQSINSNSQSFNIMTYNIRLDVKSDGINQWENRKKGIVSLIKEYQPEIIGIQEGLPSQVAYLSKELEEYLMIGEGRDGGNKGEYSAIYYHKKKVQLLKTETIWLSETPKTPSTGWDAALNRITTMGVFLRKNSKKKIVIYNAHFDHIGKIARENSAQLIIDHIKENGFSKNSIVVMGDFNAEPKDKPILLFSKYLEDSFRHVKSKNPVGTFSGFNLKSKLLKRIDYIFTKNILVTKYQHIHKKLINGNWPSDHLPISINLK